MTLLKLEIKHIVNRLKRLKKCQCKKREWNDIQFTVVQIDKEDDYILIHQNNYLIQVVKHAFKETYQNFWSVRAKLEWATETRPDISCAVTFLIEATETRLKTSSKENLKQLRSILRHLCRTSLRHPKYNNLQSDFKSTQIHPMQVNTKNLRNLDMPPFILTTIILIIQFASCLRSKSY